MNEQQVMHQPGVQDTVSMQHTCTGWYSVIISTVIPTIDAAVDLPLSQGSEEGHTRHSISHQHEMRFTHVFNPTWQEMRKVLMQHAQGVLIT